MPTHLILLAAGAGTRMLSERAKVLHEIAGAPIFAHALTSAAHLDGKRIIVTGHDGEAVRKAAHVLDERLICVDQTRQLGTAHAVTMAAGALQDAGGDTVMLYGDTPFIRPETLDAMRDARAAGADIVFLGFEAADPARYGRMVADGDTLLKIVEWKDASAPERAIT
ncbi:MAG: NTP transferase domain-containing protein, partial [Silicimonas sp.]|nr:NTP transferase domain-containing protein [Silicimonas sp.]